MNKVKQFITARRVSLGLILFLAGLMYISTIIPQEIDATPVKIEAWRRGHVGLIWLVDVMHLHRMYAQSWFSATILLAALALGVSSYDQLTVARKKLSSTGIGAGEEVAASIPGEYLRTVARGYRYRAVQSGTQEQLKFVRNPWGYFGILLLHVGMALVITVSLYVALTGRQGALILVEGEQFDSRQPLNVSEHGLLSSPLKLPGTIRLDKVRLRFDSKSQPAEVFSDISITDASGRVASLTASINMIQRYRGLRIYHAAQYGDAFTVTFTDNAGAAHAEKIMIQQPLSPEKAGYSENFGVTWSPYLFSAKCYADADRRSLLSTNPELIVRTLDRNKEIARTTLTPGSSGMLGEYRVHLDGVEKWARLIIVDIAGMPLIFAGFAIIMLGGLINYMTPPRELIGIKQPNGSYRAYWKAAAFRDFFSDERNDIIRELNKEKTE